MDAVNAADNQKILRRYGVFYINRDAFGRLNSYNSVKNVWKSIL